MAVPGQQDDKVENIYNKANKGVRTIGLDVHRLAVGLLETVRVGQIDPGATVVARHVVAELAPGLVGIIDGILRQRRRERSGGRRCSDASGQGNGNHHKNCVCQHLGSFEFVESQFVVSICTRRDVCGSIYLSDCSWVCISSLRIFDSRKQIIDYYQVGVEDLLFCDEISLLERSTTVETMKRLNDVSGAW